MKGKIFNTQEVQVILSKSKTIFREVCKRQPSEQSKPYLIKKTVGGFSGRTAIAYPFGEPAYKVGDLVFVKETFEEWDDGLVYKADNSLANKVSKWKPAQHMKQHQSRITLRIKDISVERLQDISEEDAIAEGVKPKRLGPCQDGRYYTSFKDGFKDCWNATHKKPEEKWGANPWIWKIQFEVIK